MVECNVECEECGDHFISEGYEDIETYGPGCTRRETFPDETVCPECQELPMFTITVKVKYKNKEDLTEALQGDDELHDFLQEALEIPSQHIDTLTIKE